MYQNSCEVSVPSDSDEVHIIDSKVEASPVIKKYRLIHKAEPVWTDETKSDSEIMVKLIVEELATKNWDDAETQRMGYEDFDRGLEIKKK